MHFDEVDKALDSEVREGHHAVFSDAVDPYHTVFDFHLVGDVVKPVRAFAKIIGDSVNRRDVVNLVDMHVRPPGLQPLTFVASSSRATAHPVDGQDVLQFE